MKTNIMNIRISIPDLKLKYHVICAIAILLLSFNYVKSAPTVISISGDIIKDTILDADTIKITGDINVPSNVALTITSGSYVKIMGDFGFTIEGKMLAIGNSGDSITFNINDSTGFANVNIAKGGWKGFIITGTGTHIENCKINHIKRSKAESGTEKSGVKISNKGIVISGNNFNNNITQCGVISAISGGDSCIISNNILSYNRDYGNTGTTTYNRGAIFDLNYSNGHTIQNNYVHHNYNISGVYCKFLIGFVMSLGSTFNNNTISDNYGVLILEGVNGTFSNNIIKSNTSTGYNEIMFLDWNSCPNIINNQFLGNVGIIHINSCKPSFIGNLFANNTGNFYSSGGGGLYLNNTIVNNTTMFTLVGNSLPKLTNNILWGNNSGNYQISIDGYSEPEIKNCDIQKGSSGIYLTASAYFPPVFDNVINIDPAFVSPSGGCGAGFYNPSNSWKLKTAAPFSPCINTGANIPELSLCATDISGNNRICNGNVDIGAYETHLKSISISGIINKDTLWIADTVNITGKVTVNSLKMLTIAAGTKVIFHGRCGITINGSIHAEADKNHPILFTRDSASFFNSVDSCWSGLKFLSTSDTSYLTNCTIQYADTALYFMMAYNTFVNNCRIQYNNRAILTQSASKTYFKNTLIYMNQRSWPSISLQHANAQFEFCRILNNGTCMCYGSDKVLLNNCLLANNNQFDFGLSDFNIINSTFVNNSQIGFGSSSPNIYNSIFYRTGSLYINLYGINCNPKFYNCLLKPGYTYSSGYSITIKNSLTASPAFFQSTPGDGDTYDAINADFRIKSTSPAINAGTTNVTGFILSNTDIIGNPRINGDSIDIGAYENQSAKLVFITQPVGGIHCAGDSVSFSVSVSDTATYQWQKDGQNILGADKPVFTIASLNENDEGNYFCIATNTYGNINSNPAFIKVNTAPEITDQPSSALISKGSPLTMNVRADGSRPLHYHWLKDGDEFSNDTLMTVHIDNFKSGNEGTYICIVSNNCGYDTTKQAVISIAPSICMVTVTDPVAGKSGHNLIIFEKESKIPYSKFKIYRESSVEGYYDSIGSVLSANPGIFEDTLVNPKDQAYLYKITGVKADNSETDITSGKLHKTIHLMVTKGEMGGIQLDWDQYIGFPYTTYYIERSTDGIHFSTAHKMASSTRTWTDDTIVGSNDTLYYYISVMKEDSCYPMGRKKGGSDIYSQSISNLEDNRLQNSGITKTNIDNLNLSCFPNPFKYNATISYYLQTASKVSVEIYNTLGERIATLVDMKQPAGYNEYRLNVHEILQKPGVFYLRLKVGNSMSTKKLIKI